MHKKTYKNIFHNKEEKNLPCQWLKPALANIIGISRGKKYLFLNKKEIYFVIWKIYFLNQNLLASIIGTEGKRKTGVNGGGCHQSGPNGWMT